MASSKRNHSSKSFSRKGAPMLANTVGKAKSPLLIDLQRRSESRPRRTVHVVMVLFKFDTEHCQREIGAIRRRLNGLPYKAAMQTRFAHAFVMQTHLSVGALMDLLRPTVSTELVPSIERAWCFTPGSDIAASESLDPLSDYVLSAWEEVRRWNDPAKYRRPSGPQIFERKAIKPEDRIAAVRSLLLKPKQEA